LAPGLQESLRGNEKEIVRNILKRMPDNNLALLPGVFHVDRQDRVKKRSLFRNLPPEMLNLVVGYLRREDVSPLRATSKLDISKQNPMEFPPTLEELAKLIKEQRAAAATKIQALRRGYVVRQQSATETPSQ